MLSLRATIGILTATFVVVEAAAVLTIVLEYAHRAVRDVAQDDVLAVVAALASRVGVVVQAPADAVAAAALGAATLDAMLPREDAAMLNTSLHAHLAVVSSHAALGGLATQFSDNSSAAVDVLGQGPNASIAVVAVGPGVGATATSLRLSAPGRFGLAPGAATAAAGARASAVRRLAPAAIAWLPSRTTRSAQAEWALWATASVVNTTGHALGVAAAHATAEALAAGGTAPSRAHDADVFVLDADGYLVASSRHESFTSVTAVPASPASSTPLGCGLVASGDPATDLVACRAHASRYGFAPLRFVANHTDLLAIGSSISQPQLASTVVERVRLVGGDHYFVGRAVVPAAPSSSSSSSSNVSSGNGIAHIVLVLQPETPLLHLVVVGRNVGLGVTAVIIVAAAAIAIAITTVLLAPLHAIAERMTRAAELRDPAPASAPLPTPSPLSRSLDPLDASTMSAKAHADDDDLSPMSEIQMLQQSFANLAQQLDRIQSFVPQSVIAHMISVQCAERGVAVPQDVLTSDDATRTLRSAPDDGASAGAHSTSSSRASHGGDGAARRARRNNFIARGLHLAPGTTMRHVAIVMLNLKGFHSKIEAMRPPQLSRHYANFVDVVSGAAQQGYGVLDSFHGDRVLLTFNAAFPCQRCELRAIHAALAVSWTDLMIDLPVAVGVAIGHAQVGNLGGARAKRFCTLGPVVTRAASLCRKATDLPDVPHADSTLRDGCRVLVAGHLGDDASAAFVTTPVDFAVLGSDGERLLVEAVLDAAAGHAEDARPVRVGTVPALHHAAALAAPPAPPLPTPPSAAPAPADVFRTLAEGNIRRARQQLNAHLRTHRSNDHVTHVLPPATRRAIAAVEEGERALSISPAATSAATTASYQHDMPPSARHSTLSHNSSTPTEQLLNPLVPVPE